MVQGLSQELWPFVHYMLYRQFLSGHLLLQFILYFNETFRYCSVSRVVVQELFYLNVKLLSLELSTLGYFFTLCYIGSEILAMDKDTNSKLGVLVDSNKSS